MKTNERNELVVFTTHVEVNKPAIEVFPGYFVKDSTTKVELTNAGRNFLRDIYTKFERGEMNEMEIVDLLDETAKEESTAYKYEVYDKLFFELMNMYN